jgi:pilus assembly protein CpaB
MIGIAAVFGAISIFGADLWLKHAASARVAEVSTTVELPAPPAVPLRTIVVAKEHLRFGTELAAGMLAEIPWPQDALPDGAFASVAELTEAGSRVVLSPIAVNEPVLAAKLSGPGGRATLSNLLTPGMRAVTVRTDEVAGVGGLIAPGDRVDVVLTRDAGAIEEVSGVAADAAGSTITSEVVVENAKVLTVGKEADLNPAGPQTAGSVTLEVNSEDAAKIALARSIGQISLALRAAVPDDSDGAGLTTISAFGGSVRSAMSGLAERASAAITAPQEPQFKTVIITRGLEPQSYKVIAPQE